jgi:hypothetical protein
MKKRTCYTTKNTYTQSNTQAHGWRMEVAINQYLEHVKTRGITASSQSPLVTRVQNSFPDPAPPPYNASPSTGANLLGANLLGANNSSNGYGDSGHRSEPPPPAYHPGMFFVCVCMRVCVYVERCGRMFLIVYCMYERLYVCVCIHCLYVVAYMHPWACTCRITTYARTRAYSHACTFITVRIAYTMPTATQNTYIPVHIHTRIHEHIHVLSPPALPRFPPFIDFHTYS